MTTTVEINPKTASNEQLHAELVRGGKQSRDKAVPAKERAPLADRISAIYAEQDYRQKARALNEAIDADELQKRQAEVARKERKRRVGGANDAIADADSIDAATVEIAQSITALGKAVCKARDLGSSAYGHGQASKGT